MSGPNEIGAKAVVSARVSSGEDTIVPIFKAYTGAVRATRTGLRLGIAGAGRIQPQATRDSHSAWAAERRTL
jgi:hypothetical protein